VPGSSLSPVGQTIAGRKNLAKFLGIDRRGAGGGQEDEEGVLLDCESVSITSSSTSTGKRASNAAKLLGRY
jgi:hypothetical protein